MNKIIAFVFMMLAACASQRHGEQKLEAISYAGSDTLFYENFENGRKARVTNEEPNDFERNYLYQIIDNQLMVQRFFGIAILFPINYSVHQITGLDSNILFREWPIAV